VTAVQRDSARGAALFVLREIFLDGAYINIAVNKYLRAADLSDRDRRLMTGIVYGTVKAMGTLDWYIMQCTDRKKGRINKEILTVLRMAFFQLLYMDKIPASVAVNEAVELVKKISPSGANFVNGVLRGFLRKKESFAFPDEKGDEAGYLALKLCHPRWLIKKWLKYYGREDTEALCAFNNSPAPLTLRVNTLKTDRETLLAALAGLHAGAAPSRWSADGIICSAHPGLKALFDLSPGGFYIQDESSMIAAAIAAPEKGETVIDICAAPGGKATHMAQLMGNKGRIIASDIYEHKLGLIKENAARLGINIIRTYLQDARDVREEWLCAADKVLVDAPCSGLGVLRRKAEARWRKGRMSLKEFPPLQLEILETAGKYVKDGGLLIYSTCTLEQQENHYMALEFLERNPEWEYADFPHPVTGETVNELQLLPQKDNIDGFYICVFRRKGRAK